MKMENVVFLLKENLFASIAIIILVLLLLYKKPKLFLAVFLLVVILASTAYIIVNVSSKGIIYKKELVQKSIENSY